MSHSNMEDKEKNITNYDDMDDFSNFQRQYEDKASQEPEKIQTEPLKDEKNVKGASMNGTSKKIIYTIATVAAVLFVGLTVYGATLPKNEILGGITTWGVELGGLTVNKAAEKLSSAESHISREVVINAGGKKFFVAAEDIDAELDIASTAEKAFNTAKGSNIYANAFEALRVKISGGEIMPVLTFNEEKFSAEINEIGVRAVGSVLAEHTVRFDSDGRAFIVPGKSGYNNDPTQIIAMIKTALTEAGSNEIDVDFPVTAPAPLTIESLDAIVYKNPVNASYALENGAVKVLPAEDGRYIDKDVCKKYVSQVKEGRPEIEIPYHTSQAEVDAATLESKLFNGTLASYTTRYAAGGNRGTNVAVAASKINGKILLPGETFSFNETVGTRTVANGFKTAPEYLNGQTVDGIGGGTCQVSTTLYSAVLYADLKITKRSNHSMSVSYVPLGQDATVSDGGIDFKFMNDTAYPVKISSVTGGGKITVKVIGTDPEPAKTVKIIHKPVSVPSGSAVKTTRCVYDANGNLIKEENMGTSKYKPHSEANPTDGSQSAPPTAEATASPAPEETTSTAVTTPPAQTVPSAAPQTQTPAPTSAPASTQAAAVFEKSEDSVPVKSEE